MRWLILFIVVLVASVGIGLVAREDPGYVLLSFGAWSVETTLALLLAALVAGFIALYYALRTLVNVWTAPRRLKGWHRRHKQDQSQRTLTKGMIALSEGHWRLAERLLTKNLAHSRTPTLHLLGAARAAQAQGAFERRDNFLKLAHDSDPMAAVAVGLVQAELQIGQRRMEQALATLMQLRQAVPGHTQVLQLLAKVYLELRDWKQLQELLPDLRKHKVLSEAQHTELEMATYTQLLSQAARGGSPQEAWARVPNNLRGRESLLAHYAELLIQGGEGKVAEPLLRAAIRERWSPRLVHLYGVVEGNSAKDQLAHAKRWYEQGHQQDAMLLLTLGRLCLRCGLQDKAREYLQAGLDGGGVETYRELGLLLEQMDDKEAAMLCYHKGLEMAAEQAMLPAPLAYGEQTAPGTAVITAERS